MSIEKPSLEVALLDREQKPQPRFMLDIEDQHAMILGELPQSFIRGKKGLRNGFGDSIECQIQNPIEHLDQKRPLGQDAGVPVVGKARRVGGSDDRAAAVSFLGRMCGRRVEHIRVRGEVIRIEGAIWRRSLRVVVREKISDWRPASRAEYPEVVFTVEVQRRQHYADNNLYHVSN